MKKFSFSLEKVFKFREQQLEIEMNTLALLRFELSEIEASLERMQNLLETKQREYHEQALVGMRVHEVLENQFFQENLKQQIKLLEAEIQELSIKIEKQLAVVLEFKKEVSGLEKLKEKQYEEYLEMERKAETEFILELVSAKLVSE